MTDRLLKAIEEFWDERPCNSRHSKKEVGTKEYFDEVEERRYFVEPHIRSFADFEKWRNKKVLEIGCGIGTDSINFARCGANFTGVDLSRKSLELCQKRFSVFGLPGKLLHSNGEDLAEILEEEKGSFDLVYSFGVLHHTARPDKIIKAAKSLLKPNGEFRFMVYAKYSLKLFDVLREQGTWDFSRASELIQRWSEAQIGSPRTITYTLDEIRKILVGFEILESTRAHIFPYDIAEYIKGNYVIRDCFANLSSSEMEELGRELGWHYLIKARVR